MKPALLPADTSLEAARVYFEVLRRIGPAGRGQRTAELNDGLRAVTESGVRQRHPDYTEEEVRLAVLRLAVGEELFRQAFPQTDVKP
jgi:hypothetical protein